MFEKILVKLKSFLLLLAVLLTLLGIYSFYNIPKESSPEINIPFFSIVALYPGADPNSLEEQVIQKIEDKLSSVNNLTTYKSISANNVGVITAEFARGTDKNTAYNDLKSMLDDVKSSLPYNVSIKLKKVDVINIPVYTFSILGNYYPSALYDKIRFLEDDIEKIPGVDHVDIIGNYTPEFQIRFDYEKLKKYKLSISQIVGMISSYIDKKPIDKKEINGFLYSFEVRTYELTGGNLIQKLESIKDQIANIPLIYASGSSLRLKDIANVIITHPFYKKQSYIDGKSAITYMVYKTPGTDIPKLIENIKNYLKSKETFFKTNSLENVEVFSRIIEINRTFENLINNFWQTALIILLVIALFIGLKQALGVFLAFPLVYLITFIFLNSIGYTFNTIVSFSLILTLGIMVDNLIVIIEGFDDGIKQGLDKLSAIGYSVITYRKSLLAGNLTTIAMFFPLNFMLTGRIGEFMKYLPVTINATLVFSMIVAFVFLPIILLYVFGKKEKIFKKNSECKICNKFLKIVKITLTYPKITIAIFWIIFIVSLISFIKFGKADFLPATDKNNIYINIEYDKTVNLTENKNLTSKIYNYTKEFFDKCLWLKKGQKCDKIVKYIQINIGQKQTFSPLDRIVYYNGFNPDLSYLNIVLTDADSRAKKDDATKIYPVLNSYLKEKISKLNGKVDQLDVFVQKNGPNDGKDVGFNISVKNYSGDEISILANEYQKILPKLKKISGTYGWSSSLEYTNGKINILYDLDKIKQLNLSLKDLDLFLLSFYNKNWTYNGQGLKVSSLLDVYKDIIPIIAYTISSSSGVNLDSLIIPGTNIYLSSIIKKITLNPEIKYYKHLDGKLVLNIQAYKKPNYVLGPITKNINEIISQEKNIVLTYASDVKQMKDSRKNLGMAFLLGIFLMFMVLVLNFGNYKQSLIVFSIIPLLFIGAFWLLLIFDLPFGFPAQLGMFGLIGVGVNDAILLIDAYNSLISKKSLQKQDDLLLIVVKSRLMPVFLTTLTTVLGLSTLAVKDDLWGSLALSFMGGLILGTLIILIYVPAFLKVLSKPNNLRS